MGFCYAKNIARAGPRECVGRRGDRDANAGEKRAAEASLSHRSAIARASSGCESGASQSSGSHHATIAQSSLIHHSVSSQSSARNDRAPQFAADCVQYIDVLIDGAACVQEESANAETVDRAVPLRIVFTHTVSGSKGRKGCEED